MKKEIVDVETRERLERYTDYLVPVKKVRVTVSENGTVEFDQKIYGHKKLLPYSGSRIVLNEYPDRVAMFSENGLLIVELYKDIFGREKV